jgi:hypothetical protein
MTELLARFAVESGGLPGGYLLIRLRTEAGIEQKENIVQP